jgi:hypothetical protein
MYASFTDASASSNALGPKAFTESATSDFGDGTESSYGETASGVYDYEMTM